MKRFEKLADRIDERFGRSPARIASPWQYPIRLHGQLLDGAGLNENAGSVVDAAAIDFHKTQPHYQAWADFKKAGGVLSQTSTKASARA